MVTSESTVPVRVISEVRATQRTLMGQNWVQGCNAYHASNCEKACQTQCQLDTSSRGRRKPVSRPATGGMSRGQSEVVTYPTCALSRPKFNTTYIASQVLQYLGPVDLLDLARTTRALRARLLNCHGSRQVWTAAIRNVPDFPPYPSRLCEPAYTHALHTHIRRARTDVDVDT